MDAILKLYEGRINRKSYIWLSIIMLVALILLSVIFLPLIAMTGALAHGLGVLAKIAVGIFTYHLSVRRLHDFGWTGWVVAIPIVLSLFLPHFARDLHLLLVFLLVFIPGDSAGNAYGAPPPDDRDLTDTFFNR